MAATVVQKIFQTISRKRFHVISFKSRAVFGFVQRRVMSANNDQNEKSQDIGFLKLLQPKRLQRIRFLGELFKCNGYELRIAGGAVRDLVNNIVPQDIDLATDARPEDTLRLVEKHPDLFRVIVTAAGQKHGTIAVKFKEVDEADLCKRIRLSEPSIMRDEQQNEPIYDEESPYEITTLRRDKITDGRHAEVEFIDDWKKDAERRDLTINSMFLNLDNGKLIDFFGGEQDCRNNVVKFVGNADERIKEDYLRILRYFRFWIRFSRVAPDSEQLNAIKSNLEGLNQISGERVWQELKKTFNYLPCSSLVELMLDVKLFNFIGFSCKESSSYEEYSRKVIEELRTVETNVKNYCDQHLAPKLRASEVDQNLKRTKDLLPVIIISTCIQTDEMCSNAHKRLKFSNLERDTILYIVANRNKDPPIEAFKYQLAMTNEPERPQAIQRMKAYLIWKGKFDYIHDIESWQVPHFPLDGRTVAQAVKEKKLPRPKTKEVLELVKTEWAKRHYQIDEEELRRIMQSKINDMADTTS